MPTDADLLQRYVREHAEAAFAELARRHLNLVYAAALRRTNGRHALAEEITQKVFSDLARKAAQLTHHPTLAGWLYRSTRYAVIDAARAELRRQKLSESLSAMAEDISPAEAHADWDQLRPLIDAAMDELKDSDREIMLLRFFQGMTFTDVGARLNINENAARMRTERALERLRDLLARRGITSTAALVGLLSSETLVAAPAYLAASVTAGAMMAAPAGILATVFNYLLTQKMAVVAVSAALGAALATMAATEFNPGVSDADLAALHAENIRLTQAAGSGASSVLVATVADEIAAHNSTVVQAIQQRLAKTHAVGGHRNAGQGTPRDAVRSLGWAAASGDVAALVKILTYDSRAQETLRALHTEMPANLRAEYRTPEELGAFFYVAGTLLRPVPDVEVWEKKTVAAVATQLSPGRVRLRQPGQTQGGIEVVRTPAGWRVVLDGDLVAWNVKRVLGNEMLGKLGILGQ